MENHYIILVYPVDSLEKQLFIDIKIIEGDTAKTIFEKIQIATGNQVFELYGYREIEFKIICKL
jgi:hypothetical protein